MKNSTPQEILPKRDYRLIAERMRLPHTEITRMTGIGPITVGSILGTRARNNFYGADSVNAVHEAIDKEAIALRDFLNREYLNRLSGGATGA